MATAADVTTYFQSQFGRAPTDAEITAYTDPQYDANWQQVVQNNYTYGNPNGPTPAQGGAPTPQPIAATTTTAPTGPTAAQYGVASGYVAPQFTGSFTAPTLAEAQAQPGYQFSLQAGNDALTNAAAAKGGVLSGGALKDAVNYNQGAAEQNYQQVYNNQFQNYQQNYNQFTGNAQLAQNAYTGNVNALGTAQSVSNNQFANTLAANNQNFNQGGEASAQNFGQNETLSTDYWNRLLALSGQGASAVATGAQS